MVGCFTFNIAEGAARLFFGYPFRPLQFAPLGLLEAAFIGYPRALVGRQHNNMGNNMGRQRREDNGGKTTLDPRFARMTFIFRKQCLLKTTPNLTGALHPTMDSRRQRLLVRENDKHLNP